MCGDLSVTLSANFDYTQSEIRNVLTTIHSFSSKQWMTQRQCVYELFHWHNTQLICVKHIKNSWMTISSVRISYPAECNCHLVYRMTSESYLMSSLPLLHLYINQYNFHMSCLIPRSSSTCTVCTTMYYRFFNIWNKLLKCTYVHLCLFHSKHIQHSTLSINFHNFTFSILPQWFSLTYIVIPNMIRNKL